MKIFIKYFLLVLAMGLVAGSCEKDEPSVDVNDNNPYHRILFYNVENLFDTVNQPGTNDGEFTPEADKEWNTSKLFDKLDKIARVIKDTDKVAWPALIGFCEV